MPQVRRLGSAMPAIRSSATYTVQPGDTLWKIAARTVGRGDRWQELWTLNRGVIGSDPSRLRAGMVLRLPGAAPAPAPPAGPPGDRDGDGVPDRYDRAPDDARQKAWNRRAASEYGAFARTRARELQAQGVEIDCADFAVKLLEDFAKAKGLPNPFAGIGKWSVYTPGRTGGLPNVEGPNYFRSGIHADNLARQFTRRANDASGDGTKAYDDLGTVDTQDLRPGDILFYDWDGDGEVNHTVNVIDVAADGTVTIAYGTYDNLGGEDAPLTWDNLDLSPIQIEELRPGTEESLKWLGPLNRLWGVRRFSWLPDKLPDPAPVPGLASPAPASPALGAAPMPDPVPVPDPAPDLQARATARRVRLASIRQFLLGA